jgi:hypothetical protein
VGKLARRFWHWVQVTYLILKFMVEDLLEKVLK